MTCRGWAEWLRPALFVGCAVVSIAAAAGEGWLDSYVGRWSGQGRFMGKDARYQIAVEPAVEARFVRLSVRYTWREENGTEGRFVGEALYPAQSSSAARGAWFDSEGHQYATSAYRDGEVVIVHWGEGEMRGRTEYRLRSANELEVTDSFTRGAEWQTFSRARLERER